MSELDTDLAGMTREELAAEVVKLRNAIRRHRDSTGHDLCWYQPELWSLLPEPHAGTHEVPEWSKFMEGCVKFRRSLDEQCPGARRTDESFVRRQCPGQS